MNAELKRQWIEALRSGGYMQTSGSLCDGDGYCCLGVLCEVKHFRFERGDDEDFYIAPDGRELCVDELVTVPEIVDQLPLEVQGQLAHMNDLGKSFAEIADYIEANIPAEDAHD